MKRQALSIVLAALFAAISGYTLAVSMPETRTAGDVSYISGGIGVAEQEYLVGRQSEFNLKLVFTLMEGNYVADVKVQLKDGSGKALLEHTAPGPFFMARLPAGHYQVSATYEGKTVTRDVRVGENRLRTEYLRWPANPKTDFPISRWTEHK